MEWIMVWVACGVFAAAVAASKGRSFIGWLFLGLFFGLFALLAVGFMPKAEEPVNITQSAKPVERAERKCPFCAEMIKSEAIVCKHCGRDVEPLPVPQSAQKEENAAQDAPMCPHCGGVVGPVINRCQYCERDTGY